jgi:hypothetical protein
VRGLTQAAQACRGRAEASHCATIGRRLCPKRRRQSGHPQLHALSLESGLCSGVCTVGAGCVCSVCLHDVYGRAPSHVTVA